MLAIFIENMKILGGATVFLQRQAIRSVANFKQGEVVEVLGYAFNWEGFFIESIVAAFVAPAANPPFHTAPLNKSVRSIRHTGTLPPN